MTEDKGRMENKEMNREFQWARRMIVILTALVFIVILCGAFGNGFFELLPVAALFTGAAWLFCFIGMGVSRKMIQIGDKISNKFLRVLYYIMLLPLVLVVWLAIWAMIESIVESDGGFYAVPSDPIEDALIQLFWGAVFVVILLVPYVQSLLVLILRKTLKKKGEEEEGQESISE